MSTARSTDPATEEEFIKALYAGGELLGTGKIVEAKDVLERAHQLSPRNEKANNLLGLTYFKLGLFDRAAEVYEALVRDNPVDPTLRVNLGLVYLKTNNLERCIHEFEAATDLEPGHTKAHNYLGLALAQAGEYVRAREHFVLAGSDAMADKMGRALTAAAQGSAAPPTTVQLGTSSVHAPPPAESHADAVPPEASRDPHDVTQRFWAPRESADAAPPEQADLIEEPADEAPPEVLTDDQLIEATVNEEVRPISEYLASVPESTSEVMDPPPEEQAPPAPPEHTLSPVVYDELPAQAEAPAQVADDQIEVMADEEPLIHAMEQSVEVSDAVRVATPVREPPAGWGAQFGVEPALTEEVPVASPAEDEMRFADDEGPSATSMDAAAESAVAATATTLDDMPMIEASVAGPSMENEVPAGEASYEAPAGEASHEASAGEASYEAPAGEASQEALDEASADDAAFAEPDSAAEPAMEAAPAPAAPAWVHEPPAEAADVPADPAWMTQPLSKVNLRSGLPPEVEQTPPAPDGSYAPMQAQRLLDLGTTSAWSTAPSDSPFNVGKDGLAVAVAGETLVRLVNLVAVVGGLEVTPEFKRSRGRPTQEPFGTSTSQLHRVKGHGTLYLEPGKARFHAVDLDEEGAYLREERVFAFEEPIAFENGRLSAEGLTLDMVHLKGLGRVLVQLDGPLKAMPIPAGSPMVVPLSRLVGWFGFVTPRLKGFGGLGAVELTGEGYALLATATGG